MTWLFALAPRLDRGRPSLGAMNAFFSLGPCREARRRPPFVQQISSSAAGPVAKVQTMPAEPMLRFPHDTAASAAGRLAGGRMPRSVSW